MRQATIFGRKHGAKARELVSGPDVPIVDQLAKFKEFKRQQSNATFELVELWFSDNTPRLDRKLTKPQPAQAANQPAPKKAKD
jgi:hypothetical protein